MQPLYNKKEYCRSDQEDEMNTDYDDGFKAGLAESEFTDGYWLRYYAGQAMQGILANPDIMQHVCGSWFKTDVSVTMWAVNQAKALLEEVKKHEPL